MEHGVEMIPDPRLYSPLAACSILMLGLAGGACANPSKEQLASWLKQFPQADANGDGVLTVEEAKAYRDRVQGRA